MKRLLRVFPFLLTGLAGVQQLPAALLINGSDLIGQSVQQAILAECKAAGLDVAITLEGSLLGTGAMADGRADACLLAVPEGAQVAAGKRTYPLGFQIVAFAVHPTNPVTELTYPQLANLFQNGGTLNDWSDLTPAPDWRDRKISLWATRGASSITLEIFNSVVIKGNALKQSVRYALPDAAQLTAIITADPSALVMVPAIPNVPGLRFLSIRETDARQGYSPTADNVYFGDYPLRLPFQLVVADSVDQAAVAKLVTAIYSTAVTEALQAAFFVPVSEGEQRTILSHLD